MRPNFNPTKHFKWQQMLKPSILYSKQNSEYTFKVKKKFNFIYMQFRKSKGSKNIVCRFSFSCTVYEHQRFTVAHHATVQCKKFHIFTSYKTTGNSDLQYLFYDASLKNNGRDKNNCTPVEIQSLER